LRQAANWTYYAGGHRGGLNRVYLTPGWRSAVSGLADGILFTAGVGYRIAVAPKYRPPLTSAYSNALVFTSRFRYDNFIDNQLFDADL